LSQKSKYSMYSFDQCLKLVEKEISRINLDRSPGELFEPIRYSLSMGGKRIRPCLALMVHSMFSDNLDVVLNPALGIEMFHNFTLLHDDIMDNAIVRRSHSTVHRKWNQNTAILSGDAMMILANHLILKTNSENKLRILELFNNTALEVCMGQQYDMNYEKVECITEAEYLEMIRLKTAVLLAASMALGGITGNTDEAEIEKLYQIGLNIGIAFQLQDDYLDVYASEKAFGKKTGGDIIANKKTFLLISALNAKDDILVGSLKEWMNKKGCSPEEKVKAVIAIYNKLKVDVKNKELAEMYFNNGIDLINLLKVDDKDKSKLGQLVHSIKEREH
jgi:geranylgeranyl diphosphate synthase, type II